MESFDGAIQSHTGTLMRVQAALEKAGVEFLDDDRPGVRLRSADTHPHRKTRRPANSES